MDPLREYKTEREDRDPREMIYDTCRDRGVYMGTAHVDPESDPESEPDPDGDDD